MLDSLKAQEEELKAAMGTTTQEQLAKIQNRVKRAEQDRETSLEFYKDTLRDIEGYNGKYKGDMTYEYDRWEASEGKRKEFVIEKMKQFKECVDFSQFDSRFVFAGFITKCYNFQSMTILKDFGCPSMHAMNVHISSVTFH